MATGELPKPGVEVIQTFRTATPSFLRPTLAPCVIGPAFELVNVLNSDGSINQSAKYGLYAQMGKAIAESSFPSPRGNIDEVDVLEETIKAYLLAGGSLTNLPLTKGSAFLAPAHVAGKAVMRTAVFSGATGLALDGKVLVLSIDGGDDVVITFDNDGSNFSSADCAAAINLAMGQTVATVKGDAPSDRVEIASPTWGALSEVAVRAGGSANATLQIGYVAADGNPGGHEEVVKGCGFRGQDDVNGDTVTPWIEFYRGDFLIDGVSSAFRANAAFILNQSGTYLTGKADAHTYTGTTPTYPIKVGDYFIADGVRVKDGEVMRIEDSRFKIGTINTALSVADSSGAYVSKVYDAQQVGTPIDPAPFAPRYAYFRANDIDWRKVVATPTVAVGSVSGSVATAATHTGSAVVATALALAGLRLPYSLTIDGVETSGTFVFPAGDYSDDAGVPGTYPTVRSAIDKAADAITAGIPGLAAECTTPGDTGGALKISTAKVGRLQAFSILPTGTSNAMSLLGLGATAISDTGTDIEFTSNGGIKNKPFRFKFDSNPHTYEVIAATNSLDELIDLINETVGYTVASKGGADTRSLVLTSPLKGSASAVTVVDTKLVGNADGVTDAENILGMSSAAITAGTGRPYPDAYLDDSFVLHIGAEILRDTLTGLPLDQSYDNGQLFIQYKGLRKDVSPSAKVPGVLKFSDTTTLTSVLDPISEENPLGLGLFLTMLSAPTYEVKGLGIDEVTTAAPEGTETAWARAASMLEAEEVYALAPLTQNEVIHSLWMTHCTVMSAPENGGERIVFLNKVIPTRKNPTIIVSGTQANKPATDNQLVLDANPVPGLVQAGITDTTFTPEDGVYVELSVAGEFRRYSVSTVSGSLVTVTPVFTGSQNADAFYSTTALTEPVVNTPYSFKVRGSSLVIPGSNPERVDYQTLAETVAEANSLLRNRRVYEVFPDTVKTVLGGIEKSLPGYYASAIIAGMVAAQPPQQGFTNLPMPSLTGVAGTEKFTKRQLNIMAGGGTYLLMQDVPGAAVYSRHQLSTNTTSVETRELSITKVVDFTAKFLRTGVRRFIGVNNVNTALLDTLGTTVHAILKFLEESGVLNGFSVNNIVQDKTNKDTVLIDVTLDVPYPCNYIRLTLVV